MDIVFISGMIAGLGYVLSRNGTETPPIQRENLQELRHNYRLFGDQDVPNNNRKLQIKAAELYKESDNPNSQVIPPNYLERDTTQRLSNASFLNNSPQVSSDLNFHGKFPFFRGNIQNVQSRENIVERMTDIIKSKKEVSDNTVYQNAGYNIDTVGIQTEHLVGTQRDNRPNEFSVNSKVVGPDSTITHQRIYDPSPEERRGVNNPFPTSEFQQQDTPQNPFELQKRPLPPTESNYRPSKTGDISNYLLPTGSVGGMVLKSEFTPTLTDKRSAFITKSNIRNSSENIIPKGYDLPAPESTPGTIQRQHPQLNSVLGSSTKGRVLDPSDSIKTTIKETTLAFDTVGIKGSSHDKFNPIQNEIKSTIRETTLTKDAFLPPRSAVPKSVNRSNLYSAEINALKSAEITEYPPMNGRLPQFNNTQGYSYTGSLREQTGSLLPNKTLKPTAPEFGGFTHPDSRKTNNNYNTLDTELQGLASQRNSNPLFRNILKPKK